MTAFGLSLLIGFTAFTVAYLLDRGVTGVGTLTVVGVSHPARVRVWNAFEWAVGAAAASLVVCWLCRSADDRHDISAVALALGLEVYPATAEARTRIAEERTPKGKILRQPVADELIKDPPPGRKVLSRLMLGTWRGYDVRLWVGGHGGGDSGPTKFSCAATPYGDAKNELVEISSRRGWHARLPMIGTIRDQAKPSRAVFEIRSRSTTFTVPLELRDALLATPIRVAVRIGYGWLLILTDGEDLTRPTLTARERGKGKLDGVELGRVLLDALVSIHNALTPHDHMVAEPRTPLVKPTGRTDPYRPGAEANEGAR